MRILIVFFQTLHIYLVSLLGLCLISRCQVWNKGLHSKLKHAQFDDNVKDFA